MKTSKTNNNKKACNGDAFDSLMVLLDNIKSEAKKEYEAIVNDDKEELEKIVSNIESALNSLFDYLPEINNIPGDRKEILFKEISTVKKMREKNRDIIENLITEFGEGINKIKLGRRATSAYSDNRLFPERFIKKKC